MKSKLTSLPVVIFAGLLAIGGAARAENQKATVTFSDPSKPGRLTVRIAHGELDIRGADTAEIVVESDAKSDSSHQARKDGLRVISSGASFSLNEKDNHAVLDYGTHWSQPAEFDIIVPRNTHLDLEISLGGEISVADIDGDVTIKNLNGEIDLENLRGGAIIESMNGEIEASFAALSPDRPVSITSMNGEIEVRLPDDARANVRFRSQNGTILTDFDETSLVTTTSTGRAFAPDMSDEFAQVARDIAAEAAEVAREIAVEVRVAMQNARNDGKASPTDSAAPAAPRSPRAPRAPSIPPMAGGKVISGTLNGGGTDLQIATMNGDIIVRKQDNTTR